MVKLEAEAAGLRQSVEELRKAKDTAQKEWDERVRVGEGWQEARVMVLGAWLLLTDPSTAARGDGRGVGGRGEGRGREPGSQGWVLGGLTPATPFTDTVINLPRLTLPAVDVDTWQAEEVAESSRRWATLEQVRNGYKARPLPPTSHSQGLALGVQMG